MRLSLADASALPADSGLDLAVSDWATSTAQAANIAALNASLYVPASAPGVTAPLTFSQWLAANSSLVVASCAMLGLFVAMRKS